MCSAAYRFLGFRPSPPRSFTHGRSPVRIRSPSRFASQPIKSAQLFVPDVSSQSYNSRSFFFPVASAFDEDFVDIPHLAEDDSSFMLYSSDEEEFDPHILLRQSEDLDLPTKKKDLEIPDSAITLTAHRFATIHSGYRKKRSCIGDLMNLAMIALLLLLLLFIDWCSWKIVRLPLNSFYMTRPFLVATVLSAAAGWLYIPIADSMKMRATLKKEVPRHSYKCRVPTFGGLFFIPVGVFVAQSIAGRNSIQVYGVAISTLAFATIGLIDDILSLMNKHSHGLRRWVKLLLQVAVGTWFSFWLNTTEVSSPYNMKFLVPFPPPLGLVYMGKYYWALTMSCFLTLANGVNLIDGLDGLAGGTAAFAFIGMAIAVMPICPELSVYGVSMAGACVGFLFHNRYMASVFMGDVGSMSLGGALAAMASLTGMFLPLLLASVFFVLEATTAMLQVNVPLKGHMHRHFESWGIKEPFIVVGAYVLSCVLALCAGYLGLISA